ncbi:glycosyltransferase [Pseudomonas sp. UBA1879]|uniref:glycosyltransferase n=1 Tax=Pseudomonas sp. UBA1879 TaxID=1947305 RepID=UPI0025D524CB|nr:glycosyltransferase [Pseudomonas sp. UBA1879]
MQNPGSIVSKENAAVLLAAFNGIRWIEEQINSILRQIDIEVTLYISIDPSDDGTEDWCNDLAAAHPNVVILPQVSPSGGASQNFFRLIRDVNLRDYDYIAFSDQDDIWYSDKLVRAVQALKRENAAGYSSNVRAFWPSGGRSLIDKAQAQVEWDFFFEAAGPGCTYVLTKHLACDLKISVSKQWQTISQVTLHDWYCYAFARRNGYRWHIDSEPSMDYRQHDHNLLGANKGIRRLIERYRRIHDGWWFGQVRLISQLLGVPSNPLINTSNLYSKWQLMLLSLNAGQCRRRLRDKIGFAVICWLEILTRRSRKR